MKNGEQHDLKGTLTQQRERLARWLVEWELANALASGHDAGASFPADGGIETGNLATPPEREAPVQVGHIRLMAPEGAALAARSLFVAALEVDAAGRVQVAPFGRFSEPALPGEWLTGRDDPALRVLCLWNTRLLSAAAAGRSWWVDSLSPAELMAARTIWSGLGTAAVLAGGLARRIGPPVRHPDDPRLVYQLRERAYLDQVAREMASAYETRQGGEWRLAAESAPDEDGFKPKP